MSYVMPNHSAEADLGLDTVEPVLACEECLLSAPGPSRAGTLKLTRVALVFMPEDLGDEPVAIPITELRVTDLVGWRDTLVVTQSSQDEDRQYRFRGEGTRRIWMRLNDVVADVSETPGYEPLFDSDETLLAGGTVYQVVAGLVGAHGEVVLTDRRLWFEASSGLESVLWPARVRDFELNLDSIVSCGLVGIRRSLEIKTADDTFLLAGSLAPSLYQSLANRLAKLNGEVIGDAVAQWQVRLHKGGRPATGQMVLAADAIRFEPDERAVSTVDAHPISFPLAEVTELKCSGWPDKRLHISCGQRRFVFSMARCEERVAELLPLVSEPAEAQLELLTAWRLGGAQVEGVLPNRELPQGLGSVHSAAAGLRWVNSTHCVKGWLLLTEEALVFAPLDPTRPVHLHHLSMVHARPMRQEQAGDVAFDYADVFHRYTAIRCERLVKGFWERADARRTEIRWEDKWGAGFQEFIGEIPSLEFFMDGALVAKLRPATTLQHPDGIGVLFPGPTPDSFAVGKTLTVAANLQHGRFCFRGTISGDGSEEQEGERRGRTRLLVVALQPELERHNRRGHFRLPTKLPMQVASSSMQSTHEDEEGQSCVLENLSVGGCAFVCTEAFSRGGRVTLTLPAAERPLKVPADILSTRRPEQGEGGKWLHRVRFVSLSKRSRGALEKMVMSLQRSNLNDVVGVR